MLPMKILSDGKALLSSNSAQEVLLPLYRVIIGWRRQQASVARRLGLATNEFLALEHVVTTPGIRMSELQDQLGLSSGATSTLADRLEKQGVIERRRTTTDRRGVTVHPTSSGVQRLHGATGRFLEDLGVSVAALDAQERATITCFLGRVLDTLEAHDGVDPTQR